MIPSIQHSRTDFPGQVKHDDGRAFPTTYIAYFISQNTRGQTIFIKSTKDTTGTSAPAAPLSQQNIGVLLETKIIIPPSAVPGSNARGRRCTATPAGRMPLPPTAAAGCYSRHAEPEARHQEGRRLRRGRKENDGAGSGRGPGDFPRDLHPRQIYGAADPAGVCSDHAKPPRGF